MPDGHSTDERTASVAGPSIEELKARQLAIVEEMEAIHSKALAEERDLDDEERKTLDAKQVDFDRIDGDIDRIEKFNARVEKVTQRYGRVTEPDAVGGPQNRASEGQNKQRPTAPAVPRSELTARRWGWNTLGEFAMGVRQASAQGGRVDPRLVQNAPTSFGSEGVGEDGGFLVPPDFRQDIAKKIMGEDSLLGRTDQQVSSSNNWSQPVDETTPWQTSGGIQAYWDGEADQLTQSKPQFQDRNLRLHRLTALVGVTEELRDDAPALDSYLRSKAPEKFSFKINNALINGTGVGQPLGIMTCPALVTVAKETSQAADTVRFENIAKMWGRLYSPYRSSAVWLINQDVEQQLMQMGSIITTPDGTTAVGGAGLVYMPPGGLSGSPYGTLLGRPVVVTEACQTVGDLGDIILASLGQYVTVTKTGGIKVDVSMHLWFDYNMNAYRFVMRLAGAPWLSAPISRADGSNTLSSFVALAAR